MKGKWRKRSISKDKEEEILKMEDKNEYKEKRKEKGMSN